MNWRTNWLKCENRRLVFVGSPALNDGLKEQQYLFVNYNDNNPTKYSFLQYEHEECNDILVACKLGILTIDVTYTFKKTNIFDKKEVYDVEN